MTKTEKEQVVAEVTEKIRNAQSIFITDFSGLTVEKTTILRDKFRAAGVDYVVVKNTLAKRSFDAVGGYEGLYTSLKSETAIAFGREDLSAPARIMKEFRKDSDKPKLKAAFIDGEVFGADQLDYLAALPTKEQLIARALASINAPASNLVGVMSAVIRNLMYGIQQVAEKQNNA